MGEFDGYGPNGEHLGTFGSQSEAFDAIWNARNRDIIRQQDDLIAQGEKNAGGWPHPTGGRPLTGGRSGSSGSTIMGRLLLLVILIAIGAIVLPRVISSDQHQTVANTAGIVGDGDFEEPVVYPNPYQEYSAGQSFQNWTVASGSVDLVGNASPNGNYSHWVAAHGAQSVDLNGSNAGIIYQDLSTRSGTSYSLSFAMAGNPVCTAPRVKKMQVWWGSTLVATLSFNITGYSEADMGWQYHTYTVHATGAVTRLRFASLTQSACGPALDDVTVKG